MKRVLIVHDISCYGKNSTTVVLPILSAMQLVTTVLPTALLSTHTGPAFQNYTYLDLTAEMAKIVSHWQNMQIKFDSIYIGYLGSIKQIAFLEQVIPDLLTSDGKFFLDPVMADDGTFYPGFDRQYAQRLLSLCEMADVLLPNQTEASLLYDLPYVEGIITEDLLLTYREKINALKPTDFVLTGAGYNGKDLTGAYYYDAKNNDYGLWQAPFVGGRYHGTGDIFASVIVGLMTHGMVLKEATHFAVNILPEILRCSLHNPNIVREGLSIEPFLGQLSKFVMEFLKEKKNDNQGEMDYNKG